MPPKRSFVWNVFEKIDEKTVKCKLCGVVLVYNSGSTGNMNYHIKSVHPTIIPGKSDDQPSIRSFIRNTACDPARSEKISNLMAIMIAKDCLPLSIVEKQGFRDLLTFLEPGYKAPSHQAMSSRIKQLHDKYKSILQDKLSTASYIALTTDCWTSRCQESYITFTCHFLNNQWELQTSVLTTHMVTERHTAEEMQYQLKEVVNEWNIADKIIAVVHDNATNIRNVASCLNTSVDIACSAHTLQLCVNKVYDIAAISKLIAASSKLVGHFKHSYLAKNALKDKQKVMDKEQHSLLQYCRTRWNSVFERWPITAVLTDRNITKHSDARNLELKDSQWQLAEDLLIVLEPLQVNNKY